MRGIFPDQVFSAACLNAVFFSSTLPSPDSDPACRPESEAWRNQNGRHTNCLLPICGDGFEMIRELQWTLRSYISDEGSDEYFRIAFSRCPCPDKIRFCIAFLALTNLWHPLPGFRGILGATIHSWHCRLAIHHKLQRCNQSAVSTATGTPLSNSDGADTNENP